MGWAALITQLFQLFEPLLEKWLASCTKQRLEDAADALPDAGTFGTEAAAVHAVFDRAIDDLPRWAFIRRGALARMKAAAVEGDKVRTTPLTADERREVRDIVGGIRPM